MYSSNGQHPNRSHISYSLLRIWLALCLVSLAAAAPAWGAPDSRASIERAVALIDVGDYALARAYLEPALIDPRLAATERSRAYYVRGYSFYAQNLFVSAGKDYYRALEFNPDNPGAKAALASLHGRGLGVEQDYALAYELALQAAHAGHIGARFQVARAELDGVGTQRDVASARRWLEALAEQEYAEAYVHLGRSYRRSVAKEPDPELAKQWYERAWSAGQADGLLGLAYMHKDGELGEPDVEKAKTLLETAASAGSGGAQVALGHMLATGEGIGKDESRALTLFRAAAAQSNPLAYLWLGHMLEAGAGVATDIEAAITWYRRGAQAGLSEARRRLSRLLLATDELPAQREALSWLAAAAQGADAGAQNDYAWVLATHSEPTLRDGERAVQLAEQAVAAEPTAAFLDTLAAAHAEAGDYETAVATQRRAIEATGDDERELRAELQQHLEAFEAGRPWRD